MNHIDITWYGMNHIAIFDVIQFDVNKKIIIFVHFRCEYTSCYDVGFFDVKAPHPQKIP